MEKLDCIHPRLVLQLVVPEAPMVRGEAGAWYVCLRCGEEFRTDIRPYRLEVKRGTEPTLQQRDDKMEEDNTMRNHQVADGAELGSV